MSKDFLAHRDRAGSLKPPRDVSFTADEWAELQRAIEARDQATIDRINAAGAARAKRQLAQAVRDEGRSLTPRERQMLAREIARIDGDSIADLQTKGDAFLAVLALGAWSREREGVARGNNMPNRTTTANRDSASDTEESARRQMNRDLARAHAQNDTTPTAPTSEARAQRDAKADETEARHAMNARLKNAWQDKPRATKRRGR